MKMALKDHMSRHLINVCCGSTAREAQRLMTNHWIRHLPVLDEASEHIVGILSDRDLLRSPSLDIPVEELMSSPFTTFDIETPLVEVLDTMIEEKVSAFLINQGDEIVGLVTSEDMLVILSQLLKEDASRNWMLSEIFTNPALQRAAYIIGQAGI